MDWTSVSPGEVILHSPARDYLFFFNKLDNKYTFHLAVVEPGKDLLFQFLSEVHRFEMWGTDEHILGFHEGLVNMMLESVIDVEHPVMLYQIVGGWIREEQPFHKSPDEGTRH